MRRKMQLNEFPHFNTIRPPEHFSWSEIRDILVNRSYKKIPELSYIPIKENYELVALFHGEEFSDDGVTIILIARNKKNKESILIGFVFFTSQKYKNPFYFSVPIITLSFIRKDFIGYGIGEKIYKYLIEKYGVLGSGSSLSPGAQKLWLRLINKNMNRYSVYFFDDLNSKAIKVRDYFANFRKQLISSDVDEDPTFNYYQAKILITKKNSKIDAIIKQIEAETNELEDRETELEKNIEDKTKEKYLKQKSFKKMKKL